LSNVLPHAHKNYRTARLLAKEAPIELKHSGRGVIGCIFAEFETPAFGVDASAEMLRIAAARDNRIEWIKDDMREPSVEGQFDLVVCCYHTLQYILTEEDIIRVFNAVRLLLQPWGMFAFDIYQPNFDYLSIPRTDHLVRSTIDSDDPDPTQAGMLFQHPISKRLCNDARAATEFKNGPCPIGDRILIKLRSWESDYTTQCIVVIGQWVIALR
jgi:SAM-dependent methyltransferase